MMRNTIFFVVFFVSLISCRKEIQPEKTITDFAKTITETELKQHLSVIAGAEMEGRNTPSPGLEKTADYIIARYQQLGVTPGNNGSYRQTAQLANGNASNIIGVVEGSDKKDEYVAITAHYDHVGKDANGNIFYGADDNGSGTVALLEIAEAFIEAKKAGKGPRRTIVFIHFYGEEKGLWGSVFYNNNPIFPLAKTSVALNMDMVGRIGNEYLSSKDSINNVYIIGTNKLSSELRHISDSVNAAHSNLVIDRKYEDPADPQRIFYRSDQYSFAAKGVPVLFFFGGLHPDYHTIRDTPDKIHYFLFAKRVQYVFYTAWSAVNREGLFKRDIGI